MEEFEKLVAESFQAELMPAENVATENQIEPVSEPAESQGIESVQSETPVEEKAG